MPDFFVFVFGLLATIMGIGPLIFAMVTELREKQDKE